MEKQIKEQMEKTYWDIILNDLQIYPPKTDHIEKNLKEIIEILCSFNPNRKNLNEKVIDSLKYENIIDSMPQIINELINWIERFQQPAFDNLTNSWRKEFINIFNNDNPNIPSFIVKFMKEYYEHILKVRDVVYAARRRILNGESPIPPEYRQEIKGENGIPKNIKSGK